MLISFRTADGIFPVVHLFFFLWQSLECPDIHEGSRKQSKGDGAAIFLLLVGEDPNLVFSS